MNKADMIEKLADQMDVTKTQAEQFLNAFSDIVITNLNRGDDVKLIGFGTFLVRKRKARMGYNPQTRQPIKIAASRYAKFLPSSNVKSRLNENHR